MWHTIITIKVLTYVVLAIPVVFGIALAWRQHRKTEATRQATCIIMGLPRNTSMKEFKRMHKEMNKHG